MERNTHHYQTSLLLNTAQTQTSRSKKMFYVVMDHSAAYRVTLQIACGRGDGYVEEKGVPY